MTSASAAPSPERSTRRLSDLDLTGTTCHGRRRDSERRTELHHSGRVPSIDLSPEFHHDHMSSHHAASCGPACDYRCQGDREHDQRTAAWPQAVRQPNLVDCSLRRRVDGRQGSVRLCLRQGWHHLDGIFRHPHSRRLPRSTVEALSNFLRRTRQPGDSGHDLDGGEHRDRSWRVLSGHGSGGTTTKPCNPGARCSPPMPTTTATLRLTGIRLGARRRNSRGLPDANAPARRPPSTSSVGF
jgi:hypothetical protein